MTMTRSETGLRITHLDWLWGAIGVPLAVFFIWQSVLHVHQGGRPGETAVVILASGQRLLGGGVTIDEGGADGSIVVVAPRRVEREWPSASRSDARRGERGSGR